MGRRGVDLINLFQASSNKNFLLTETFDLKVATSIYFLRQDMLPNQESVEVIF